MKTKKEKREMKTKVAIGKKEQRRRTTSSGREKICFGKGIREGIMERIRARKYTTMEDTHRPNSLSPECMLFRLFVDIDFAHLLLFLHRAIWVTTSFLLLKLTPQTPTTIALLLKECLSL
jgi:hypothetical protein